jgi:hypothetical protein
MGASLYRWQVKGEDSILKIKTKNPDASFFPKAELVICFKDGIQKLGNARLAYKFNIYAIEPLMRENIFVDAQNGEIILGLYDKIPFYPYYYVKDLFAFFIFV